MKAIMKMAHEVRNAAANTWGGRPGEYSMSIALEMAWEANKTVKENRMSKDMYAIAVYESYNKSFPYRVIKRFDSPEGIIEHILNETDEDNLNYYARACGLVISSKWINEDKSIPRQYIKGNNNRLIDALERSPRPGAKEAAAKLAAMIPSMD